MFRQEHCRAITRCAAAVALAAAFFRSAGVFAGSEFPNADGSGDLASSAAWGDVAHGTDADVELKTQGAVYTASSDLEFYSISWTKSCTIDFSATPNRKVTFSCTSNGRALFPGGTRETDSSWANDCGLLHIKGGTWDFGGYGAMQSVKGWNRSRNSVLKIDCGAVVTNTRGIQVAYQADGNSMIVTGGSRVYDGGAIRLRDSNPRYSLFEVSGGAYYEFKSGNLNLANGGSYNTNVVKGAGTVFTNASSAAVVYSKISNSENIYTDGAKVYMPSFYYGQAGGDQVAASNNIEVSRGAEYRGGILYMNQSAGSFANNLRVLDGGVFNAPVYIQGSGGSEVVVSNATLAGSLFRITSTASTGNVVRIIGPDAVFAPDTLYELFGSGWNKFVFDGCEWGRNSQYCCSYDSGTNRVEIVNGAKVSFSGIFRFECYSGGVNGPCGNTVFVGAGSELTAENVHFNARDNALVISNGLYTGTSDSQSLMLAGSSYPVASSGNRLVMQGARPRARMSGNAYFRNDSLLVFDVPAGGYDLDGPLITCKSAVDDGSTTIEIGGELEKWRRSLRASVDVTLVETTSGVGFSASAIAAADAALPEGFRLAKSADGKSLVLHAGSLAGTFVVIR